MPERGQLDGRLDAVARDGCALAARLVGRAGAPVVVLAHPIGFDGRFWAPVVDRLVEHFTIILPDARGHGRSARGRGETSIDQLAEDIVSLLDAAGVDRAGYAGCSLGSAVGMRLGAAYPDRFAWLVLANAPARIMLPRERFDEGIAAARAGDFPRMARGMLSRWLVPGTEAERPELFAALLAQMTRADGDGFADAFAALRDSDRNGDLGHIRAPTLVITGEHDDAFPPDAAFAMAQAMGGGRVTVVPAAGHLVPVEQPGAFAELVRAMREPRS